ncbi:MAG TPA: HAD domain-containing protein, partial [Noviherbaspirillum sp.]
GTLSLLPQFEAVIRDFPAVDIVISSAWRQDHSLEELRSFFSPDIAKRIVAVTPIFHRLEHQYLRQSEITAWLRDEGREYETWLAIDDSDWYFSPGCRNLILTSEEVGFDEKTAWALRRRLSK